MKPLQTFVDEWLNRPMIWGQTDCACMAAALVREVYGRETIFTAPRYRTERGALQHMAKLGVADLLAGMDTAGQRMAAAYAMPGDVMAFPAGNPRWGGSLGLVLSARRSLVIDPEAQAWAAFGDNHTGLAAWRLG